MSKRPGRLPVALFMALYGLVIFGSATVYAHATLFRTDPADGTSLTEAPKQVRMWFTEPIVLDFTRVELVDSDGQRVVATNVRREVNAGPVAGRFEAQNVTVAVADLPPLPPSAYRMTWQTRSEDDLHVIKGAVTFGVQRTVQGDGGKDITPPPSPLEVGLRWFNFMGFSLTVGSILLGWLVLPSPKNGSGGSGFDAGRLTLARRRLRQLTGIGGGLALASGIGLLAFQGASDFNWWQILSQTTYGTRWLLTQALLITLLGVLLVEARPSKPRRFGTRPAIGLLTLALLVSQAFNSHSTGQVSFSPLNLAVDLLHLAGASLWAGGLLALAGLVVPLLSKGADERGLAWAILRRFGKLAGLSLFVLIVTGLYKSGQQVASLDGLLTTLYGQALLFKVELVLFGAFLGLLNAALLHPGVARSLGRLLRRPDGWRPFAGRHLGRALLIEAVGMAGVLLLAALLGTAQPARGPEFDPLVPDNATASTVSQPVNDLIVTLSIKPNRPGQNFLNLGVFNTRRPAPAPIEAVTVHLQPPGGGQGFDLPVEAQGGGRYQISGEYLSAAGEWNITISLTRPGLSEARLVVPWQVSPTLVARRPVVFSNQPLAEWLNWTALLLIGLVFLLFIQYRWRLWQRFFKQFTSNKRFKSGRTYAPHEGNNHEQFVKAQAEENRPDRVGATADRADYAALNHGRGE